MSFAPLSKGAIYGKENRGADRQFDRGIRETSRLPAKKIDPFKRNDGPDKRGAFLEKKLEEKEILINDLKAKVIELNGEKAAKKKEFLAQEIELSKWKGKYDTLQQTNV